MTGTAERVGCDISDMLLIHRFLRKMFGDAVPIVRSVPPGDAARTAAVAAHVLELTNGLHNHHRTEDVLLWDAVAERAPACGIHVALMRLQHDAMAVTIRDTEAAVRAWRDTAAPDDAAVVAGHLDALCAALAEHLGDEERRVLPEVARTFTQREWNLIGQTARKERSGIGPFVALGFLLDSLDPAEAEAFARDTVPAPVRGLYRLVGRRQYLAYRQRVYGTAA